MIPPEVQAVALLNTTLFALLLVVITGLGNHEESDRENSNP